MRKWLLTSLLTIFVVGGLLGGAFGIRNLSALSRPTVRPSSPGPVVAANPVIAAAPPPPPPQPKPQPQPQPEPTLRDFDQAHPPFEPAGQANIPAAAVVPTPVPAATSSGHMNILLMGIDQRPDETVAGGDPGRTDSMILVSLDFDTHLVSMVSIPRDGYVVIPDHGNERVNAAYTFGELDKRGDGPKLAERTVEQLFGIHVDHYALVDIRSMQKVIDTLGGVWIDNPQRLVDTQYPTEDYRTIKIDIPPGQQLMDGVTAVEYARTRHPDSDYGRQGRQQQVLMAIRDRALQLDVVPRIPQLLPQVLGLVHTDISPVEAVQLANFGRDLDPANIVLMAPDPDLTPSYVGPGGASYVNLTQAYRATVHAMLVDPRVANERAAVTVYNGGAPVGSGSRAATLLGANGLVVNQIANAAPVTSSRIEAGSGAQHSAALVAHVLGIDADAIQVDGDSSKVTVFLGPDLSLPTAS